jgi:3'(2'), 5'-bisphosphate nucleotidase
MTDRDFLALAHEVEGIAAAAGAAILDVYRTDFAVRAKADQSPVTNADEASEAIILKGLRRLTPSVPVVAEESLAREDAAKLSARFRDEQFWLVDPLDGTIEFVHRRGQFTVNIALIEQRRPVLGVVLAPVQGLAFVGVSGSRAWRRWGSMPSEPISARLAPRDGFDVLLSLSHRDLETDEWLKTVTVRRIEQTGSSIKFCRIAAGEADLYPRFGRTWEWDTAAGHAVLAAAGGSVRGIDGRDLLYGKPEFVNPPFIARGRQA